MHHPELMRRVLLHQAALGHARGATFPLRVVIRGKHPPPFGQSEWCWWLWLDAAGLACPAPPGATTLPPPSNN